MNADADAFTAYRSGAVEPWTVSTLLGLIYLEQPKEILELGAFEGRTTRAMGEALPPGSYLTSVEMDLTRARMAEERVRGLPRVSVVHQESRAFLRDSQVSPSVFDFAFVDDDHDAEHVAEEIRMLREVMMPGGLIVLHDVVGEFGLDEVVQRHGGVILNLPLLHAAGGLGLIRV